jgi:hypothetical protein
LAIPLDTSAIVGYLDPAQRHHRELADWIDSVDDDLVITPLVLAEVGYLLAGERLTPARQAFYRDLGIGAYQVEWWPAAIDVSIAVAEQYADSGLGLADASLVALADHLGTIDIATLDERHFRAVRPLSGGDAFRLLPLDV